jgi:Flp pilus assembly CpaE family ATPase
MPGDVTRMTPLETLREMDKITHTILLIEDSPYYAKLIQVWIAAASGDTSLILTLAETLEAGLRRLAQGGVDLILLDLDLPDSTGLKTLAVTRANAPGIPIVVLSASDDEAITIQAIQEGAEDYLVKDKCGAELLLRVVESAIARHKARPGTGGAGTSAMRVRVIGVLCAVGGAGATTVACNLAVELGRQTSEKVLLADLSLHTGLVSFMLGLANPMFSMRDAVANLDRLDQSCWEGMVTRGPADLHIMPSPDLLGADDLPVAAISQVLNLAKPFYQWIVLDLGRLNSCSMGLLRAVDHVLVVTTTAVPCLYGAIVMVAALKGAGFEETRLSLIVNQIGKAQPLSAKEIDKLFGIQIAARLPADPAGMEEAFRQKTLPRENSIFRRHVAILARQLAGLSAPMSRGNLWPLFRRSPVASPKVSAHFSR